MSEPLERLYQKARAALKSREYARASDLLRQILQVDENYKDTSRLLAQAVRLRRRRWYNQPLLWVSFTVVALVALGFWIAPHLASLATRPVPTTPVPTTPTATLTVTASATPSPTSIPTPTPLPTSTSIPLAWKRLSMLQELPRDAITSIVVNPKDPDVIYVGTQNAGIFKSIDSGNSWRPASVGLTNATIDSLVINPDNPNILFAGIPPGEVYKTTDGTASWQASSIGIEQDTNAQTNIVMISPKSPERLYFYQGGDRYYRSTNAGLSWEIRTIQISCGLKSLIMSPANPEVLFAASRISDLCLEGGIYRSNDDGESWDMVFQTPKVPEENLFFLDKFGSSFSISQDGQEILYFTWVTGSYISTDGGTNWGILNASNCAIRPENSSIIMCLGGGVLLRSQDAGTTFHMLMTIGKFGWGGSDTFITFKPGVQQEIIFIGAKGLYESRDHGYSWANVSNGLAGTRTELTINSNDPAKFYMGVTGRGNSGLMDVGQFYFSLDGSRSWDQIANTENNAAYFGSVAVSAADGTIYRLKKIELSAQEITLYDLLRSKNNGRTWEPLSRQLLWQPQGLFPHPFIPGNLYIIHCADPSCKSNLLINSQDGGYTWNKIDTPSGIPFNSMFFGPDEDIYLLNNKIPILHLSNSGQSSLTCDPVERSETLANDPADAGHLYLGTRDGGVYISQDGCQSRRSSNAGLGSLYVNTIAVDPNKTNVVFAGTDDGAYISFNNGETWGQINDGLLGATVVYSIAVDKDSNVYAATPYGIFQLGGT